MIVNTITNIEFELTSYCNAKCPQCPRVDDRGQLRITPKHLNLEIIKNNFKSSQLTALKHVILQGSFGDPIMYPFLDEVLEHFSYVPQITLITNGGVRSSDWWASIARHKNLFVIFSVDGLQDTNHLYRINTEYSKIENNFSSYINNGGQAIWKCIVFKHNQHQIDIIKQKAKKAGFIGTYFQFGDECRFYDLTEYPVYVDHIHQNYSIEKSTLDSIQNDVPKIPYTFFVLPSVSIDTKCPWQKSQSIYIDVNGLVLPCCMLFFQPVDDDPTLKGLLGGSYTNISLDHYSLDHIIKSDFYQTTLLKSLTNSDIHSNCANCIGAQ